MWPAYLRTEPHTDSTTLATSVGDLFRIVTLENEQSFDLDGKYCNHDHGNMFLERFRNISSSKNLSIISILIPLFTEIIFLGANFEIGLHFNISAL